MGSQRYNYATNTFSLWQAEGPILYTLRSTCVLSCSVVSHSLQPFGLYPVRFLRPWDCSGKNTEVGYHFLVQALFPIQGSNLGLLHCRWIFYWLSHHGNPWEVLKKNVYMCVSLYLYIYAIFSWTSENVVWNSSRRCLRECMRGMVEEIKKLFRPFYNFSHGRNSEPLSPPPIMSFCDTYVIWHVDEQVLLYL